MSGVSAGTGAVHQAAEHRVEQPQQPAAQPLSDRRTDQERSAGECLANGAAERAQRVLQLQDDARWQYLLAEGTLKTVRHSFDRVAAGDFQALEPAPAPVSEQVLPPVKEKRSPVLMASACGVAFVAMVGVVGALYATALREPAIAAVQSSIGETDTIGSASLKQGAQNNAAAVPIDDLGRSIYAARFAKAPASEKACLARAVYYEARGEETAGQIAVAQVVLNRARAKKWPTTICGVVNQGIERGEKCQFSFACQTHAAAPSGEAWADAQQVAEQALQGQAWLREFVEATHYHTKDVAPVWRTGLVMLAEVGTHIFYRSPDGLEEGDVDAAAYLTAATADASQAEARAKAAAAANAAKAARLRTATRDGDAAKKASARSDSDWSARLFQQ